MTKLWTLFSREYGTGFITQWGDTEGQEFYHWTRELMQFSEAELVAGWERFKQSSEKYLNLANFRACLKPAAETLQIEPFETALRLVNLRAWEELHPAFQRVAMETYEDKDVLIRAGQCLPNKTVLTKDRTMDVIRKKWDLSLFRDNHEQRFTFRNHFREYYDHVVARVAAGEVFERVVAVADQRSSNPSGTVHTRRKGNGQGKEGFDKLLASMKRCKGRA